MKYRTENQDRRTRRELAPRRPRGRERRGAGESAPTAIVDDKEPLPSPRPTRQSDRPPARPVGRTRTPSLPPFPSRDARRGERERALRRERRSIVRSRSSSQRGSTGRRGADRRQPTSEDRGGIVSGERTNELTRQDERGAPSSLACLPMLEANLPLIWSMCARPSLPPFPRFVSFLRSEGSRARSYLARCPHFLKMGVVRSFVRSSFSAPSSRSSQTTTLLSSLLHPCGETERAKKGGSGE